LSDAEDKKEVTQDGQNADEQATPKKGGLMKYIMIGGIAIVCISVGVFAGLMFMGDDHAEQPVDEETATAANADSTHNEQLAEHNVMPEIDSLFLDENDPSVIEMIEENLAVLDWDPNAGMFNEENAMSAEDSTEALNWLDNEKKKLALRESDLTQRENDLAKLDQSVSKKLLQIEYEESSRISKLAKLYDGMDSRSVVQLMANLDDKTVVSILPKMKGKNASSVLQLMPPQRAARLSKQLITIAEK